MISSSLFSLINLNKRAPAQIATSQVHQRTREGSLRYGVALKGKRLFIHTYAQLA